MRISDWSSDVCSSDLLAAVGLARDHLGQPVRDQHGDEGSEHVALSGMGGLSQAHMVVAAGAALDGIVSTRWYRAPAIVERNETDGFRRVARREEEPEPGRWRRRVTPPRAKTPLHVSIFPEHGTRQLRY